MNKRRITKLENSLDNLYENWREVRRETITQLGENEALKILDFHGNNWIDIIGWISSRYQREEQMNIVYFQFLRVFKEIFWLQFLFYTGNYSTAYRNLRYLWEMMSQAYFIDLNYPRLTLDEQFDEVRRIEQSMYGWNVITDTLCRLLNQPEGEIRAYFKPLWSELNKHIHPSAFQMDVVATEDFSSLITDSFNKNLARSLIMTADKVFDITYAIIFNKFTKAKELAQNYKFIQEWNDCLPITMSIVKSLR